MCTNKFSIIIFDENSDHQQSFQYHLVCSFMYSLQNIKQSCNLQCIHKHIQPQQNRLRLENFISSLAETQAIL